MLWMFSYCECCVLSRRGPCVGPITRPNESYLVSVCVCVSWDRLRTSVRGGYDPESGRSATGKHIYLFIYGHIIYIMCSFTGVVKDRIWEPTNYTIYILRAYSDWDMKMTTGLHVRPRLRTSGSKPPFLLYVSRQTTRETLLFNYDYVRSSCARSVT